MSFRLGSLPLVLLLLLPEDTVASELWTVDPAGGPADFDTIQAAVDAAGEGDVILVDSSAPAPIPAAAGFVIDGKSLTVIAEDFPGPFLGGKQIVNPSVVQNLGPQQRVVLRCLQFTSSEQFNAPSLRIERCEGSVFVEDCFLTAGLQLGKREALLTTLCNAVVLARCSVDGGSGNPFALLASGRPGIVSQRSRVLVFASEVLGGGGVHLGGSGSGGPALYGLPGQPAILNVNGELFASGCVLRGGEGGHGAIESFGCLDPGPGGCSVRTEGTGVSQLQDVTLFPGAPGPPAPGCPAVGPTQPLEGDGTVVQLEGKARGLVAPAPLPHGATAGFHLMGQPGDFVFLGLSYSTSLEPHLGVGWSVLDDPVLIAFVGTIGPGGELRHLATPAPLSPRIEASVGWFQARFLPRGGGAVQLSNPSIGVRLGPG